MIELLSDFLNASSTDIATLLGVEAESAYKWITVCYAVIPLYFCCKCFVEIIRGMFRGGRS